MFGSEILEVVIGVIFVYLLVSVICSAVREGIEAWLKTRASYLEHGIRELLHDLKGDGLATAFYNHPLIFSLFSGKYRPPRSIKRPGAFARGGELPSYIPSKNFALALMDIAARGPDTDEFSGDANAPIVSLKNIRTNIANLKNPAAQRLFLMAIDSAHGDLDRVRESIEEWYDSAMERVSGWYKRTTQWIIFWIALAVTVGLNVNTITIADYLYRNDAQRAALLARAESAATDTAFLNQNYAEVKKELDSMSMPIGWTAGWGAPRRGAEPGSEGFWNNFIAPIFGWLLTAFAATMGAPFWFDVLKRVMVIRSAVKPDENSSEEESENRQAQKRRSAETVTASQGGAATTEVGANPADDENDIDGCRAEEIIETSDEELPRAEGGVA